MKTTTSSTTASRTASASFPGSRSGSGKLSATGGPLDAVATEFGATVSQICLAWLLRRSPVMLPIPGTSSLAHLEENCARRETCRSRTRTYQELTDSRKAIRRWALSN